MIELFLQQSKKKQTKSELRVRETIAKKRKNPSFTFGCADANVGDGNRKNDNEKIRQQCTNELPAVRREQRSLHNVGGDHSSKIPDIIFMLEIGEEKMG